MHGMRETNLKKMQKGGYFPYNKYNIDSIKCLFYHMLTCLLQKHWLVGTLCQRCGKSRHEELFKTAAKRSSWLSEDTCNSLRHCRPCRPCPARPACRLVLVDQVFPAALVVPDALDLHHRQAYRPLLVLRQGHLVPAARVDQQVPGDGQYQACRWVLVRRHVQDVPVVLVHPSVLLVLVGRSHREDLAVPVFLVRPVVPVVLVVLVAPVVLVGTICNLMVCLSQT